MNPANESPDPSPFVTVIVVACNRARFLREALESILTQSYRNIQLVVVYDDSPDETEDILNSFHDPRLDRVLLGAWPGISRARNAGLRRARGTYLTFFDSDDVLLPESISRRIRILENNPKEAAVFGRIDGIIDKNGAPLPANNFSHDLEWIYAKYRSWGRATYATMASGVGVPGHTTALYRRSLMETVGPFDEDLLLAEDLDFILRIAKVSPLLFLDEPVMRYRIHDCNASIRASSDGIRLVPEAVAALNRVLGKHDLRRVPWRSGGAP